MRYLVQSFPCLVLISLLQEENREGKILKWGQNNCKVVLVTEGRASYVGGIEIDHLFLPFALELRR